jgi:two-component system chemotaxis response regulator CheY
MTKVLIVDDSATVRLEVSSFFENAGVPIETANDGKDGLRKLQSDQDIGVIIADVNMPNMDGLTMAEKIRHELHNQEVKIIMLTTVSDKEMKQRAKAAGVMGWIVKPFRGENVLGSIKRLLSTDK